MKSDARLAFAAPSPDEQRVLFGKSHNFLIVFTQLAQRRNSYAQIKQSPIKLANDFVLPVILQIPIHLRPQKSFLSLRIRKLMGPLKSREFFFSSFAHRFNQS